MAKIKYYYDTETCKYERIKTRTSDVIVNFLGFVVLSFVFGVGVYVVFNTYFESPQVLALKNEVTELKYQISAMEDDMNQLDQWRRIQNINVTGTSRPHPAGLIPTQQKDAMKHAPIFGDPLQNNTFVQRNVIRPPVGTHIPNAQTVMRVTQNAINNAAPEKLTHMPIRCDINEESKCAACSPKSI